MKARDASASKNVYFYQKVERLVSNDVHWRRDVGLFVIAVEERTRLLGLWVCENLSKSPPKLV